MSVRYHNIKTESCFLYVLPENNAAEAEKARFSGRFREHHADIKADDAA